MPGRWRNAARPDLGGWPSRWRSPPPPKASCGAAPRKTAATAESILRRGAALAGKRIIVTSGPTHEPIDPVRYIANRSSGKQGHAIAPAPAAAGAAVVLVSGPVNLPDPPGVAVVKVETAQQMLEAVDAALPADAAIFAAAVADWRSESESASK